MFQDYHSHIVLAVIVLLIISLYKGWLSTALTFLAAISTLLIFGIITAEEALHGFANEQLAIIILLLILSYILRKSPAVNAIFRRILKRDDNHKWFLTKMMGLVGINSAFFNNTPLVAMLMPYVYDWCKENDYSPSKFLIPLSYASILGGCVTLIGTSTTLIVNAIAVKHGVPELQLFDLTPIGLPMLFIGGLYLLVFAYPALPSYKINTSYEDKQKQVRQYFMETNVGENSPIIGKSVQEAGLRNLNGLFLVEVLKGAKAIRPVSSQEVIQAGDILFFAGDLDAIRDLNVEELGLSLPKNCETSTGRRHDMTEVVVSHNSPLVGRDVRENDFRSSFDGAVLAIHRNGERIWGHLGNVKLKSGDVLLVMAGKDFQKKITGSNALYQISNFKFTEEPDIKKVITIFGGMIVAIVLAALNLFPLFHSLILLLVLSFFTGLANPKDIKQGIDYNLILIIALGLALGTAMNKSGASDLISNAILPLADSGSILFFLFGVFILTNILSAIITSKAAVAILIPILLDVGRSMDIPDIPLVLLIAFAAAANFITPMGYQTNLMVYGPGRYSFKDFVKIGTPLTIIYMVVCVFTLYYYYNLS